MYRVISKEEFHHIVQCTQVLHLFASITGILSVVSGGPVCQGCFYCTRDITVRSTLVRSECNWVPYWKNSPFTNPSVAWPIRQWPRLQSVTLIRNQKLTLYFGEIFFFFLFFDSFLYHPLTIICTRLRTAIILVGHLYGVLFSHEIHVAVIWYNTVTRRAHTTRIGWLFFQVFLIKWAIIFNTLEICVRLLYI